MLNPVEHEFCVAPGKRPTYKLGKIWKVLRPSVKPDDYVAPKVQGKLNHQMAKPGARPPIRAFNDKGPGKSGDNNGSLDNGVAIIEG